MANIDNSQGAADSGARQKIDKLDTGVKPSDGKDISTSDDLLHTMITVKPLVAFMMKYEKVVYVRPKRRTNFRQSLQDRMTTASLAEVTASISRLTDDDRQALMSMMRWRHDDGDRRVADGYSGDDQRDAGCDNGGRGESGEREEHLTPRVL